MRNVGAFGVVLLVSIIIISGCVQKGQPSPSQQPPTASISQSPVSSPAPSGKICPAVCVPLWAMQNNNCAFVECGSGCGADEITTFKTEAECKSKLQPQSQASATPFSFSLPKKSAHWEGNIPEHGSTIPAPPVNIVIDANFDLAPPSSISITKDGKEYGTGDTLIDSNKLAMRRLIDGAAPDGVYTVNYKACWPDTSCHDGNFQFAIDRPKSSGYQDLRNKAEITISLSEIKFNPAKIRISKGTKVIWKNDDSVVHYVNSDLHPSHTYLAEQNSKALNKGDTYEFTFNTRGFYPYHCSAHADMMKAEIIVE